jgi:hypothetical protein
VSQRAQARAVLDRALAGDLSIDDLYGSWPEKGDPLTDAIFEETEDTIEHTPGSLLGSSGNRFRESIPYKILVVDHQLLLDDFADIPPERLVEIRRRLLKELDLSQGSEAIAKAVREFIGRETGNSGS